MLGGEFPVVDEEAVGEEAEEGDDKDVEVQEAENGAKDEKGKSLCLLICSAK